MINAALHIGSDIRLFQHDQLLVIYVDDGNSITYNGQTVGHGTFGNVPRDFVGQISGAYAIGNDVRLFGGNRLVVVDVYNNNQITYDGHIRDHGTYRQLADDFARDFDDVIQIGPDTRIFKGDRLVVIDVEDGNKITYDGPITGHGTFSHLPSDFSGDFDAVHTVGNDVRIFKGNRLVVINFADGNKITFDDRARNHGTYHNVPPGWLD
ncbi:hypothetical protein Misp01_47630 [Microtetraspora sp. NBRC 13810]|uniref:hypothetical protein n=1 Tax=Microtetraspora sp. NBRC 13810 TaxID=3030990 RepID=UPI0024A55D81|nr:hypothetical protein [Microtetraspora sp. NBRC 13810]GLW09634.1 hypothetical protein Misp01_47630 [Microtetraspora sp. NBRC 13810]